MNQICCQFEDDRDLTLRRKSSHICGGCDIFFHSSWISSRKIKENSWKEREKNFSLIWAYIYHSPISESIAGIFQMKNDEEILKLATYFKIFR